MEMLEGVFKWLDVISPSMIGEVLVSEVFPQWHEALYHWLLLEDADYGEIGQWFEWWQDSVFPDEIKALPSITAEFDKGTTMIDRALDLGERAKTELKPPERGPALQTRTEPRTKPKMQAPTVQPVAAGKPQEEVTFRHVMEDWCQENDLQFIPERKRVHAEGPLYRITALGASLYARNTDTEDFAEKILQLLDDPLKRAQMGAYGRTRIQNELAWKYEEPKLLAAYAALFETAPLESYGADAAAVKPRVYRE